MIDRTERYSSRVLLAFAGAGLPETLAVRAAAGEPTEILLYDEIGPWGVTAKDFLAALDDAGPGPIRVRINSPGGSVFDGLAMHSALVARGGQVECVVDGIAASAASFIAMAGATLAMHESSMLMIHNASGLVYGNRHAMTQTAGVLAKIDGQLAAIYAGKTGAPMQDMSAAMDAETWYTAAEAQAAKLCDSVIAAKPKASTGRVVASFAARRVAIAATAPVAVTEPDTTERDLLLLRLQLAAALTA